MLINLQHAVTDEKFYVQARTAGGSTAQKEIRVTVTPFKCDQISSISVFNTDPEIISVEKNEGDAPDAKLIKNSDEVKAWFKIDTTETSKKAECFDLKFKLEKKGSGLSGFIEVTDDELVRITSEGQI